MDFALETYIRDISICDEIIDFFHNSRFAKIHRCPGITYGGTDEGKKSTDLTMFNSEWETFPVISRYIEQLRDCTDEYVRKFPYCNEYGPWGLVEGFNIQWYKPGEGFYNWHTERCNASLPHNDRHLVWMTYLNHVEQGGGTEFYHQKHTVQARKGKTLIQAIGPILIGAKLLQMSISTLLQVGLTIITHLYLRGISSAGRAPALQAGCQEFESPILHNGLEYIRAHVSERKKNRNPTRVGERWEPSWCHRC